jgi:hypothetical protein
MPNYKTPETTRKDIRAVFLFADKLTKHDVVEIPAHMRVTQLPARVAYGARKPKIANRGDAPTLGHAARDTKTVAAQADRRVIRSLAAIGWRA